MELKLNEIRKRIAQKIYKEPKKDTEEEEILISMNSQQALPLKNLHRIQDEWVRDGLIR